MRALTSTEDLPQTSCPQEPQHAVHTTEDAVHTTEDAVHTTEDAVHMTEDVDENVSDCLSEVETRCTIFDGASQEDVAYAKVFWTSVSLLPPTESRLVSADIRQRLKVAKAPQSTNAARELAYWPEKDNVQQSAYLKQKQEEKQKYMEMAKNRDQIIDLLKRQRKERLKKEMVSVQHKPRKRNPLERFAPKTLSSRVDEDQKEVENLQ